MGKYAVLGAGSWGTALAMVLANKGHAVTLTGRNADALAAMEQTRENTKYLPGILLPDSLALTADVAEALSGAEMVVYAVPAQTFGQTLAKTKDLLAPGALVVNVAKGIEQGTLRTLSQVAEDVAPGVPYAVLSGPSHAEEVGRGLPTTVAVAAADAGLAQRCQEAFFTDRFRVYTNDDLLGVEVGGALKNIMAVAAGISDGLGFGDNAKAALMTRGVAEIARLGLAMGAKEQTFAGLTGIGDLIVTCTSMHSRNRRCGILIGQGHTPKEARDEVGMVVEGLTTCEAANALSQKKGVEMPITEHLYRCLHGEITAAEAIHLLMSRSPKKEQ